MLSDRQFNRLPYWLVTFIVFGIGSGSGQASKQYGPDNLMVDADKSGFRYRSDKEV